MKIVVPRTWVSGTPRGYGDRKTEDEWLAALARDLSVYKRSVENSSDSGGGYDVDLEFMIWPRSPTYRGQNLPHGTDLDNLIKTTIDGLASTHGRGLGIIFDDSAIYGIKASKFLVMDERSTGVWITIREL